MKILKEISFLKLKLLTLALFILFVILFTALIVYEEYQEYQKEISNFKRSYIQQQKELVKKETLRALRYIQYKHSTNPLTSQQKLKAEIIDAIEHMRNERDGTGYIFIYTFDGVNVADPIQPNNKGKNLLDFSDPTGKKVIKELIETAKAGGGFVKYLWIKPTTHTIAPKLSYAAAYEPFRWMVGSGVYLDDIDRILQAKESAYKDKLIKYIINIVTLSFILLSFTIFVMRYVSILIEHSLAKIKSRFNEAANTSNYIYTEDLIFGEFKEIARYANKMIRIIQERTKKLKELNATLELKVLKKTEKLRKQTRELQKSKELAEKLLQDQDRFLKTAIHEINTPLSIILANIDLLKMEGIRSQELTNIESGIKIIHNIYNDLSYLVKKDRVDYPPQRIDLAPFLQERISFFQEVAKGSRLRIDAKNQTPCTIEINPTELQRLIDNNLSNAIKYAYPDTSIIVKLYKSPPCTLEFHTRSKKILDPEAIFEHFYKEDEAKGGFGLGLALVKEICDKYGIAIALRYQNGYNIFSYTFKGMR